MKNATLPSDVVRCTGRYEKALDAFGQIIRQQCIGCQRRMAGYPPGHSYFCQVPVFDNVCPQRLESTP